MRINLKPFLKVAAIALIAGAIIFLGLRIAPHIGPTLALWKPLLQPANAPAAVHSVAAPPAAPAPVIPAAAAPARPVTVPAIRRAPAPDPVAAAFKKFTAGEYTEAADALESLRPDDLTAPQRKLRTLRLLQTYMHLERYEAAQNIIDEAPVSDGLYHLIKSQLALRQNQFESALGAAREAQTTPTVVDYDVRKKASFQIASILHTRFTMRPNQQNTQLAREAWEGYLSSYCTNDDAKDCREAGERLMVVAQ
jgi:hypothetical protein